MTTTSKSFTLHLEPRPADRPRSRVVAPKGRKPFVQVYSDKDYEAWKKEFIRQLGEMDLGEPFTGPVAYSGSFFRERPKTTKLYAPAPDLDNFVKAAWDAMTVDGRIWEDDEQVVDLDRVRKRWAAPGCSGFITITVTPLDHKDL